MIKHFVYNLKLKQGFLTTAEFDLKSLFIYLLANWNRWFKLNQKYFYYKRDYFLLNSIAPNET